MGASVKDKGRAAALLGAVVMALEGAGAGERERIVAFLERELGAPYDDLGEKFAVLLGGGTEQDRVYGLWLFYISVFYARLRNGVWIGPDFAGDDQEECLRLSQPVSESLRNELMVLARAVAPGMVVEAGPAGTGGTKFALRTAG